MKGDVNMVELDVLGWDNGFGQDKLFTVINSRKYKEEPLTEEEIAQGLTKAEKEKGIKKARFASIHMVISGDSAMSNSFANDYSFEKMDIEYNGTEYFIGPYALIQDPSGGIRNFDPHKYREETEIAKLGAGLALLFPDDGKIIIKNLVMGVSIRIYKKSVVKEINDLYKNKTFKFTYPRMTKTGEIRRKELIVEINNVTLIPQGIGSIQDVIFDINGRLIEENGILDSRYGVIDVGTNTVDGFIRQGFNTHIEGSEFGIENGTSDVYRRIASKLGIPNYYNQIEYHHTQGKNSIFYYGQERNFGEILRSEFEAFAKEIYAKSGRAVWNRHLETLQKIVLTGGCAYYLKDTLEKLFKPIPIVIPDDPQFSNARGYYKNGIFLLRSMMTEQ